MSCLSSFIHHLHYFHVCSAFHPLTTRVCCAMGFLTFPKVPLNNELSTWKSTWGRAVPMGPEVIFVLRSRIWRFEAPLHIGKHQEGERKKKTPDVALDCSCQLFIVSFLMYGANKQRPSALIGSGLLLCCTLHFLSSLSSQLSQQHSGCGVPRFRTGDHLCWLKNSEIYN